MQTQESPPQPPQMNEQNLGRKARRPLWLLGAVGLIVILMGATSCSSDDDKSSAQPGNVTQDTKATETTKSNATLFPGRVDSKREDKERNIGQGVEISGYTTTVTAAAFKQSVSDYEDEGYVMVDVTILNRDDKAQSYNLFDWKLQTASGQVLDPTFTSGEMLGSGNLVKGGTVAGKVPFKVGTEKGDFYIIYKPDAFDAARGIWKVTR